MASNAENISIWWRHHVILTNYALVNWRVYVSSGLTGLARDQLLKHDDTDLTH